jgi:hypothetical protein
MKSQRCPNVISNPSLNFLAPAKLLRQGGRSPLSLVDVVSKCTRPVSGPGLAIYATLSYASSNVWSDHSRSFSVIALLKRLITWT